MQANLVVIEAIIEAARYWNLRANMYLDSLEKGTPNAAMFNAFTRHAANSFEASKQGMIAYFSS